MSLDALRGLAALAVVLGHSRFFLTGATGIDVSQLGALQKILLIPSSFAVESVAVFFVLSGYLVGGQVLREVDADRFVWRTYFAKRFSRLWTVLVPGLILTALIDHFIVGSAVYARSVGGGADSLPTFLCNIGFLQESRCSVFGSNESLWSLSYEFWFYVLFAGATVAVASVRKRVWLKSLSGIVAVAICLALFGVQVLALIPAWLFGVGVALLEDRLRVRDISILRAVPAFYVASIILFAAGLAISNLYVDSNDFLGRVEALLVVGLTATPIIALLAINRPFSTRRWMRRFARTGDWSYSSYVYHAPIAKLLIVLVSGVVDAEEGTLVLVTYAVALVAYGCSILLWSFTERKTSVIRNLLMRVLRAGAVAR